MKKVFACIFILVVFFASGSTLAQDNWVKIFPVKTKSGELISPDIDETCKYRFAWQIPDSEGQLRKITFESGRKFNENKFLIDGGVFLRTEITAEEVNYLRPLLNFDSLINKIIENNAGKDGSQFFYLLWEKSAASLDLMTTFVTERGSSNGFVNLRPEDSMAIEELCPNYSGPVVEDITEYKPSEPVLSSSSKNNLSISFEHPELIEEIKYYRYQLIRTTNEGKRKVSEIRLSTLRKKIQVSQNGRYRVRYRIITKNGNLSKYSNFSNFIRIK